MVKKPYEEIGAIFNGNEVKIRVPKSTFKPPKLTPSQLKLQNLCTCDDGESICSETCGIPGDASAKINFTIPEDICESLTKRTAQNSEMVYSKQMPPLQQLCSGGACNITPADAPPGVCAHKVLHPDKDVFVLKIGKQADEPNRTGNIEVELVTPRAPAKLRPASHTCQLIQCEECDLPGCAPCRACHHAVPRRRRPRSKCCT